MKVKKHMVFRFSDETLNPQKRFEITQVSKNGMNVSVRIFFIDGIEKDTFIKNDYSLDTFLQNKKLDIYRTALNLAKNQD